MSSTSLQSLPSVDRLLNHTAAAVLIAEYGRPLTLDAFRKVLDDLRHTAKNKEITLPDTDEIIQHATQVLATWTHPTLQPVINASGVILHTNLGRAPLSQSAMQAVQGVAQSYSNLEYDLAKGKRGSRYVHAEDLLKRITGAEAALVVNNNAAALLLILSALARRRRVLIGRTQLIEIGGGFRIPEVMKQSGASLVEVGATNKVHLDDYRKAIEELPIKLVLRAHRSNFKLVGFTAEPTLKELAELTHSYDLPFVDDLGSGTFLDTVPFGLEHEMTVMESLAAGSDLVCFSGDKLLGGPQAGIIVGRADLVAKLRKHPIARAVRADKLALAALSATLMHYVKAEAENTIPIWQMISATPVEIENRAQAWQIHLGVGQVISGQSAIGGGSLPGETLPTHLLAVKVEKPDQALAKLRQQIPPVIARIEQDQLLFDPRTVLPTQEDALLLALTHILKQKLI